MKEINGSTREGHLYTHQSQIIQRVGKLYGFVMLVLCVLGGFSHPLQAQTVQVDTRLQSFPLENVHLLDSPFRQAMLNDAEYLLMLNMDRLLAPFYIEAGLEPKAPKYGGWESTDLKGHTLGHYLSALSMMYAATHDKRFQERVDYIVDELAYVQQENGGGYLGGIPDWKEYWQSVVHDTLSAENFDLNGVWSPWYNLHKTYAGLRDAYLYTSNEQAKQVLINYADWAVQLSEQMSDQRFTKMLGTEFGGMNEVLADVYAMTGERKYLELANRFNDQSLYKPLLSHEQVLEGLHSNTQIPKIIGAARIYELTGEEKLAKTARIFWEQVALKRSYVMGGNSYQEYFGPIGHLSERLGRSTAETCNTYNMLKLTKHLMKWDPRAVYADFYERALYNHILASQDPTRPGAFTYYVSLDPGGFKTFSNPYDSFWCCVGTGMENHAKYGTNIYLHNTEALYLNLFIPSVLKWEAKGVTVRQETNFPKSEQSRLVIQTDEPVQFTLHIRRPYWVEEDFSIRVNGESVHISGQSTEQGYVAISRRWEEGDEVIINLPMEVRMVAMRKDPSTVAFMYGPLVLAGELGQQYYYDPMPYALSNQSEYFDVPSVEVPVLSARGAASIDERIEPVEDEPLHFKLVSQNIELSPFYSLNHQHYTVYWQLEEE